MKYTDKNIRPMPVAPMLNSVPTELRNCRQWVLWKYQWKEKESVWAKIPVQTSGAFASTTDPATWNSFENCFLTYDQRQNAFDGLGFVFTKESPFVGIDLDNCLIGEKGQDLTAFAVRVCEKLNTYTEVSPSKTGLHLIGTARDITALKTDYKGSDIEVYRSGRYFTFTGRSLPPMTAIRDVHDDLTAIIHAVRPPDKIKALSAKPEPNTHSASNVSPLGLSNQARLKMALNRPNVQRLFGGATEDFGGDDSRADLALVRGLAFYSDGSRDILDWMFRQSKLMRPKWDEMRGADTYGNITLGKVLSTQTEYASFARVKEASKPTDFNTRKSRRISVNDIWDSVMAYRQSGDAQGVTCGWNNLSALYRPAKGQTTVVTGNPGSGKSTMVDVLTHNIARLHGWKFTFASFETLPMQRHILNFAQIAVAKPTFTFLPNCATDAEMMDVKQFLNEHFHFIMPSDDELTITHLLQYVADDIQDYDIDGFVLDPYTELDEQRAHGETETQHIKQVLKEFQRFTRHNNVHSWLIAHPAKSSDTYLDGRPSLRSIAGSQNFYNKFDFGIVVHRVEDKTKVFVDKVRFETNGEKGECEFSFDKLAKSYTPVGNEYIEETEEQSANKWRF